MLKIEHTICPSCSIGCGINIISKNNEIVGTHPYKYHKINEGKTCNKIREYIEEIKENKIEDINYKDYVEKLTKKIKETPHDKILLITSGNTDNTDLNDLITFSDRNNYELYSYEQDFKKINTHIIPQYNQIKEKKMIITINDIYRENPLIARRIINAKENKAELININTHPTLTSINSDKFIKVNNLNEIPSVLESLNINQDTLIVTNQSFDKYSEVEDMAIDRKAELLPILKHPNSYATLQKTIPLTRNELEQKIQDSDLIISINDDITSYIDTKTLDNTELISINPIKTTTTTIPIKLWANKNSSYTNTVGTTQEFKSVTNDDTNNLKTLGEVLLLIEERL